ncbi:hypothetical protein [Streptomyces sp. NPDC059176]|uniref:hypothetical protein n=1 Tax=Streptomyces sp. NPDC059176 TaxID=3346758 RepID=UPI003682652E
MKTLPAALPVDRALRGVPHPATAPDAAGRSASRHQPCATAAERPRHRARSAPSARGGNVRRPEPSRPDPALPGPASFGPCPAGCPVPPGAGAAPEPATARSDSAPDVNHREEQQQ